MKKLSRFLVGLGLVLIVLGFAIGPVVPYQDPTPEMLAKEKSEEVRSTRCLITGVVACASGAVIFLVSRFKRPN
jgi:hypothetical protein